MEILPALILSSALVVGFSVMAYFHYRVVRMLAVFKVSETAIEARQLLASIEGSGIKQPPKREPQEALPENLSPETLAKVREQL